MTTVLDAEAAIEKALKVAEKARLPMIFVEVVKAVKKNDVWEVVIKNVATGEEYRVLVSATRGEALEWRRLEK